MSNLGITIYGTKYIPKFKKRKSIGGMHNSFLVGFESEYTLRNTYNFDNTEFLSDLVEQSDNFFYIKEEYSVRHGIEINSHPFNWKWFENNKDILFLLQSIPDNKTMASRECGFHVHLDREYFSYFHLEKIVKFFYENPDFIKSISLRGKSNAFRYFARLNFPSYCNNYKKFIKSPPDRHYAINISSPSTLEIRIFQGTKLYNTIKSYIEFAFAITFFTKKYMENDMKSEKFIDYVIDNEKFYPDLINLINGELKWK